MIRFTNVLTFVGGYVPLIPLTDVERCIHTE